MEDNLKNMLFRRLYVMENMQEYASDSPIKDKLELERLTVKIDFVNQLLIDADLVDNYLLYCQIFQR